MDVIKNMEALARKGHEGAIRKGREHLPYIVHPEAVVKLLKEWGYNETEDAVTLAVAWGHDLLEDTKVSDEEILAAGGVLGEKILAGIKALTFVPPKEEVSDAEWDRIKGNYLADVAEKAAPEILVVKMADRLCNTRDFLAVGTIDFLVEKAAEEARKYLSRGAALFKRVGEMKYAAAIAATLNTMKQWLEV